MGEIRRPSFTIDRLYLVARTILKYARGTGPMLEKGPPRKKEKKEREFLSQNRLSRTETFSSIFLPREKRDGGRLCRMGQVNAFLGSSMGGGKEDEKLPKIKGSPPSSFLASYLPTGEKKRRYRGHARKKRDPFSLFLGETFL